MKPALVVAALLLGACSSAGTLDESATTVLAPPTSAATTTVPATTTTPAADPADVSIGSGSVIGVVDAPDEGAATVSFRAIPFAQPPVGELRWAAPAPPEPWAAPFVADTQGMACPQVEGLTNTFLITPPQSEDCLTLDVVAPVDADGAPVMVWLHGGGFTSGSAHQPVFDGTNLAQRGVVTVAANYRLGPLGFLVTDQLSTDTPGPVGNWGIQDQVLGLEWVRDNIGAFGGDPDNVTIFGQSAGGFSVCAHLALPASAGLFHRAIVQSGGGCDQGISLIEATGQGTDFVNATSCGDAIDQTACLRELPVDELLEASEQYDVASVVLDDTYLATTAFDLAGAGFLPNIPFITGSTLDEMTLFTLGADEPTDEELAEQFAEVLPASADAFAVIGLYAGIETNLEALQTFLTDMTFACSAERFADLVAGSMLVWRYELEHRSADEPFGLGATHGADLVYVFGNPDGINGLETEFNSDDANLADFVQSQWVAFAADGAPGGQWPVHTVDVPNVLRLLPSPQVSEVVRDGRCADLVAAGAFDEAPATAE